MRAACRRESHVAETARLEASDLVVVGDGGDGGAHGHFEEDESLARDLGEDGAAIGEVVIRRPVRDAGAASDLAQAERAQGGIARFSQRGASFADFNAPRST